MDYIAVTDIGGTEHLINPAAIIEIALWETQKDTSVITLVGGATIQVKGKPREILQSVETL